MVKKTKNKKTKQNPKFLKALLLAGIIILIGVILSSILSAKKKSSEAESRKTYSVHIIAGQSNAVGLGSNPANFPSDSIDRRIKFYYAHDSNSGGKIVSLRNQRMPINKNKSGFGPEVGLSRQLYQNGYENILIIKVAKSGTSMKNSWNPKTGPLYRQYIERETSKALAELSKQGYRYSIDGFYWMQGEGDMNASAAPTYKNNLKQFISSVRANFNNPKLKFVIGRPNNPTSPAKYRKMVRDAQTNVAKNTANVSMIDTDDLELADFVHYNSSGQLQLGNRFFLKIQPYMAKKYPNGLK